MSSWLLLSVAILAEVVATSALKSCDGFSKLGPSIAVLLGYALAFYCLSLTLRVLPIGITYAVWSGVGLVFVTLIGWIAFQQRPDLPALIGMGLILAGVLTIQVFSKST